jgi:hypothetical protein
MTTLETFDVGAPKNPGGCHIGLYQPILNRFLLTVNHIRDAQDIALIAASRYPLFLVNLVTADNYNENLIDNLCCENWSLPNQQITPTKLKVYANLHTIVDAEHLLDNPSELALSEEKKYLQLCCYYLRRYDEIIQKNTYAWEIKKFMTEIFDFEPHPHDIPVQNLKKQIVAELFLCKDIKSTTTSIENIITKAKHDHDLVL